MNNTAQAKEHVSAALEAVETANNEKQKLTDKLESYFTELKELEAQEAREGGTYAVKIVAAKTLAESFSQLLSENFEHLESLKAELKAATEVLSQAELLQKHAGKHQRSFLIYSKATHSIQFAKREIGLILPKTDGGFEKQTLPVFSNELLYEATTSVIPEDYVDEAFPLENLKNFLQGNRLERWLDASLLENAVSACNMQWPRRTDSGETMFQQAVYTPLSYLLMSSAVAIAPTGHDGFGKYYGADEQVHSSLYCNIDNEKGPECHLSILPDACSTVRPKLDCYGMLEIKTKEDLLNEEQRRDYDRCVLATASTAIMLRECKMNPADIVLPFVIGQGFTAHLYVTIMGDTGPGVKHVQDCVMGDSAERRLCQLLFLKFALLLAQFGSKITGDIRKAMAENFARAAKSGKSAFTATAKRKKKQDESPESSNTGSNKGGKSSREESAVEAVQSVGQFSKVEYPWAREYNMTTDTIHYQTSSPYYFEGVHTESNTKVFLKVWCLHEDEDDQCLEDPEREFDFYKHAQDKGVPVARLMSDHLLESEVRGLKYCTLATEYIGSSCEVDTCDSLLFTKSLLWAVNDLHKNAGLLHCDIKRSNVRWDKDEKQAKLIDFGHAQWEAKALPNAGTPGYEAPEVVSGGPHSRLSDAYSIGKTLLGLFSNSYADGVRILELAEKLTLESTSTRCRLEEGLVFLNKSRKERTPPTHLLSYPLPRKLARTRTGLDMKDDECSHDLASLQ